jgi:integrase
MASVSKDQRWNRYWYAHFVDSLGRRRKKSTRLTSKAKALEMAHALQRASNEARRGVLTEARTRELLSEILQTVNGEGLRSFTVREWFDLIVQQKRKSRATQTAKRHAQLAREFIEFLGVRANLNVAAITAKDILDFRNLRESKGLAPATLNLDINVLSAVFNAALRQGLISSNPCAALEKVKNKAQRKSVFTPEQVSALVKTAEGDWRGLILTAFYIGARLNDCANLRWRNVDLVSDIKTIRFVTGKTGREIVSVIHPALEDYLLSLKAPETDDDFLFPSLAQRATSPLSKEFRLLMEQARIEQRVIRERNEDGSGRSVSALSFHSLRHSFSSLLANAGIAEETRMALTGHTTRDMQQHYTHRELQILRDAVNVLPRV